MSAVLRRLWARIRNPTYCVGSDLEGNRFYEYPAHMNGDVSRTKRVVKYAQGRDMWYYVAGSRRLPVQWSSWLSHTRPHPPSLEELYADIERQRRVKANAALIEARDREESTRLRLVAEQEPAQPVVPAPEPAQEIRPLYDATSGGAAGPQRVNQSVSQDVPSHGASEVKETRRETAEYYPPTLDEPTQWSPRSVRRGG